MKPVIDGWEASRQLKSNPATSGIPIIALSAHALRWRAREGVRGRLRRVRHQAGGVRPPADEDARAAAAASLEPVASAPRRVSAMAGLGIVVIATEPSALKVGRGFDETRPYRPIPSVRRTGTESYGPSRYEPRRKAEKVAWPFWI